MPTDSSSRLAQVFLEVRDRTRPRVLGRFRVEAVGGVVVEAVLRAGVDVALVANVGRLERGLVRGPAVDQALVLAAVQDQHRGLDVLDVFRRRRAAVERHAGRQLRHTRGKEADHAAAVTEADRADLAVGVGPGAAVVGGSDEVLARLGLIELREQLARLVFAFLRVAAERGERIGRDRQEVRRAPGAARRLRCAD